MGAKPLGDAGISAYAQTLIRVKAKQLTRKPGFGRSDQEDLEQDLAACLISKLRLFDASRAKADTFADRVIASAVAMILRDRGRQKRAAGFVAQSLDATVGVDQGRPVTGAEMVNEADHARRLGLEAKSEHERIDLKLDVDGELAHWPPNLLKLCQRLLNETKTAIAQDMGITPRELERLIEMIRQRFRAAGLDEP